MTSLLKGLSYILICYAISAIVVTIFKESINSSAANRKNVRYTVCMPKAIQIISAIVSMVFAGLALVTFYAGQILVGCIFLILAILMVLFLTTMILWKIDATRNQNYFIWRTSFGRRYKVKYCDCISRGHGYRDNSLKLEWNNKTIEIPSFALNFSLFDVLVSKKGVKFTKKEISDKDRLSWLKKKVIDAPQTIFSLALLAFISLVCFVLFGVIALKMVPETAESLYSAIMYAFSALGLAVFLLSAVVCPLLIKVYPKYKKLTHLLLDPDIFRAVVITNTDKKK